MSELHDPKVPPGTSPGKTKSSKALRLGVFVRGVRAEQLRQLALKYDTQPGRVANRLLCEALDLAARDQEGR